MAKIVLFLVSVLLVAAAEFQVQIKNLAGNTYNISCSFVAQSNNYGTSVNTKTVSNDWRYVSGNEYSLYYQRLDSTHAQAMFRIAGVFTVAMMTDPFSAEYELDLFVANLATNELKTGQPHEAAAVPMNLFVQQWVTVRMTKKNGYCQTTFYSNAGKVLYSTPNMANCYTNGVNHQIVVNSRSRDLVSYDEAFVTIDSITWQQT